MNEPEPVWWVRSYRADKRALPLADRHYNRQKPGSPQFVPPGRCLVLLAPDRSALWVSSWPKAEYVKHAWPGSWICSCFRRELPCPQKASELIIAAEAATRWDWGDPPRPHGFITFVDPEKVRPTMVRGRKVWGFGYLKAGWIPCGETKGGLLAFQRRPDGWIPDAAPPREDWPLFLGVA